MTMNIMSVSAPTSSELGSVAMGKTTATPNRTAGLFAEVFSQESESQSSSASKGASTVNEQAAHRQSAHSSANTTDEAAAHSANQRDEQLESETEQDKVDSASTKQVATAADPSSANKESAIEKNQPADAPEVAVAGWVSPVFAPLTPLEFNAELVLAENADNPIVSAEQHNEKLATSSQQPAEYSQQLAVDAKRQGGSALPLEQPASNTPASVNPELTAKSLSVAEPVAAEESVTETALANKQLDKAAPSPLAKANADSAAQASTKGPATESVNTATISAERNDSDAELTSTALKQTTVGVAQLAQGQTGSSQAANSSANSSQIFSAQSVEVQTPSTQASSTQTLSTQTVSSASTLTDTAPVNNKTAQILAEYAEVKVQAEASAQDAKTEQTSRHANVAPDAGVRSAAPEWLAQIEHGKRWSQSPTQLAQVSAAADEVSALGEKTGVARAINGAFTQTAEVTANRKESTDALLASGQGMGNAEQAKAAESTGPEASGLLINREQTLLAATPERNAMLDKALTLHGSAEQNAKQLAQQAQVVVSQNLQEAEIKLNPSEFGAMRIQIRMEQGEVQVQFVASHPQARDLLEQAMPRLREMLQQQGMNLHQGQQQSGQQQAGQQQQGQPAPNQTNGSLLASGVGQGNSASGESGQQNSSQSNAEDANTDWRSYSATGDEVQEQTLTHSQRALYGADGAKIDFFA